MQPSLDIIKKKILNDVALKNSLAVWKLLSKKIVFTNGCFDIIHLGHVDYLSKAADEGDILIVGLNSDFSARGLKGNSRPINSQDARAMILAAFQFISAIVIFDEPTPLRLISVVQPDVLVKGGDYEVEKIVGYDIVKAKSGIVKTIDFLEGYSTTSIEQKILSLNKS